jgi:ABC-type cobalamin/Fe3+-siderophores transport system ATPase subunit
MSLRGSVNLLLDLDDTGETTLLGLDGAGKTTLLEQINAAYA